jgi:regulatory protein
MDDDLYQKLINAVFRLLSIRPRSIREIRNYLDKKTEHSDSDTVNQVMVRLTELGYADDYKFAQWLVSQRQGHKPKGDRFIQNELKLKGVSPDIISHVFEDPVDLSQKDLALKAVSKKLSLWAKLPIFERRQKLFTYLMRQGFSGDTAKTVIDEVIGKSYNNTEE